MQWYYAIDGQRSGPVPHAELERLIQAGTITGEALVWRQGMDQWKTLADVQARDPALFTPVPPPLPPVDTVAADTGEPELVRGAPGLSIEGKPAAPEVPLYAGFWERLGAHVVDFILWWFMWQVLVAFVGAKYFPEAMAIAEKGPAYQAKPEELIPLLRFLGAVFTIGVVWAIIYDAFFILRFGATPGKLLLNLRVVQANGQPLGLLRIIARTLTKGVAGIPTLGIGLLVVAFDEQKRGLHDFFSGTRVVKKR
jgi:uncharacterized RDD family membrane protein YckC